jgi:hypothetical protein
MSRTNRTGAMARVLIGFAIAAGGVVGVVKPYHPAFAQAASTPLSADQVAAIDAAVQTALANIDPNLTGAARAQALSQALAQVATTEITQDGAAALGPVVNAAIRAGVPAPQAIAPIFPVATSMGISAPTAVNAITMGAVSGGASAVQTAEAVIAVAIQTSVTGNNVGNGLGQAAATLSTTNPAAAAQIAVVVSNEGTLGTGQAFGSSVLSGGGSTQLASVGQQTPNANALTGAIANTTNAANATTTTNATSTVVVTTPLSSATSSTNSPTISLGGASQQISAVNTVISCTTPSCS